MPGAPNRPPEIETPPAPAPAVVVAATPAQRVLRRLAPSRVALRLDLWKGNPSAELTGPLERAEAAYVAGEHLAAENALDQLSVRFAEPRWPTLPEPFRELRVKIPAPMPPHWDPENALPPAEKAARRATRDAQTQLALLKGVVDWVAKQGTDATELATRLAAAARLDPSGAAGEFWSEVDAAWEWIRASIPMPTAAKARPVPAADPETG